MLFTIGKREEDMKPVGPERKERSGRPRIDFRHALANIYINLYTLSRRRRFRARAQAGVDDARAAVPVRMRSYAPLVPKAIHTTATVSTAASAVRLTVRLARRSEERRVGKECRSGWWQ